MRRDREDNMRLAATEGPLRHRMARGCKSTSHVILVVCLLSLTVFASAPARAQGDTTVVQIGEGALDSSQATAPKWVRIDFEPTQAGPHTVRVLWDSDADVQFSVFEDNPKRRLAWVNASSPAGWSGVLDPAKNYYLGVWSANGIANYVADIETVSSTTTVVQLGEGTLDNSRATAPRWVRIDFEPIQAGPHTVRVFWDGDADVRLRVFEDNPKRRISTVDTASPAEWTGVLDPAQDYYLGVWSASGIANYTAEVHVNVDAPINPRIERVLHISVDGLRSDHVTAALMPSLHDLVAEGVSTLNARTAYALTQTLPNHSSQFTGRPIAGANGHGLVNNVDLGRTMHQVAGEYVSSIFDVVHDHGLATAMFVGKDKFLFHDRSWDTDHGAPDLVGADNGTDKIDLFVHGDSTQLVDDTLAAMGPGLDAAFTFFHIRQPDGAGHGHGWLSAEYEAAVQEADDLVGQLVAGIEADPELAQSTAIIVTADHGGPDVGTLHADQSNPDNYIVPFIVWAPGVPAGADLYALNPSTLADPGLGRVNNSANPQPLRTGYMANVALSLLDLPSVPGSTHNFDQTIDLFGSN